MQLPRGSFETVSVSLRAWAPFFPGDEVSSNTPGAVFQVHLHNGSGAAQSGTLAFSFHGPRHEEIAFNGGPRKIYITPQLEYQRRSVEGTLSGVAVETTWDSKPYSYVLGVVAGRNVRRGGELVGTAWKEIARSLPPAKPGDPGASVAVDFSLRPGETTTIPFVLSWYAPTWNALYRRVRLGRFEYAHQYATRFRSAQEVAEQLASRHDSLLRRILAWQEVIYGEQRLPGWLQDSLINVLAVLPQESFWLRKSAQPDHWWGSAGLFTVNESLLAAPQQSCIGNDQFGEWPVNILFPELARNKLRQFKHYQKANGQVPSTLGSGTEPDQPWYDQQLTMDGQIYVQMVDRYWQVTGDDSILQEFYPSVKAQMKFMESVDTDGDSLLDVKGSNQYYDVWPRMAGTAIHVSTYWLATLQMAERMAKQMGDEDFAAECHSWFERGRRSMEEKLWNQRAGSYRLYHQPATGILSDSVLSDQLVGQWFAHLHDLERIVSHSRAQTVLDTIWRNNLTSHGVRVALKPDGSPDSESLYSLNIQPSYSTIVPAALRIYEGDREKGLDLMRRTWRRLVIDLGMAWDMPQGLDADGNHRIGLEYYHNSMLWSFPAAVLEENLKSFSASGGLVDRIKRAARE